MADYCTHWFEWIGEVYIGHCCKAHDLAYELGNPRLEADFMLVQCVWDLGLPVIGVLMGLAVMPLGWMYYKPKLKHFLPWLIVFPFMVAVSPSYATTYDAVYIRTIDADTHEFAVTIWPDITIQKNIRLNNIDTPETTWRASRSCRQAENEHGEKAKAFAIDALENSLFVRISDVKLGKYAGRVLGEIILSGGRPLSELLITEGYAVPYDGGPKPNWCEILK